ncbi:MAG: class I SAM-dependent RNA methyltransferase [Betaproteobacteria bacterium]|nr:class I SAM-dependent RNA methyltransferase [Betaproteobacteria bacterium]
MSNAPERFFAICPHGLSAVLADELQGERIGATVVASSPTGVAFSGSLETAWRANLHSRVATRILWQVAGFPYRTEHDVYDAARLLAWTSWFPVSHTIKVEVSANRSPVKSLDFTALKVKDAVCDTFREIVGSRPNVARQEPDVRIHLHLEPAEAALYLDFSGEPLFKRGRRDHTGLAPLKKNLAAGILILTGWDRKETLLDPMCGSGTFLVEAAEMALGIAPGMSGGKPRAFGFEKLSNFDAARWKQLLDEARAAASPPRELPIYGSDLFGDALKNARDNLAANGLAECVFLKQANAIEISAPTPTGVWITNPPYGDRLGEAEKLKELYPKLGDTLKQKFAGWRAYFFTGDMALAKLMRLSPSRKTPLFNGKIECRLLEYRMVAGSNRKEAR